MASSESKKRKREEYEMQLLGFHSRAVNSTLKGVILENIQSKCTKLCESLEKNFKPNEEDLKILKRDQKRLIKAYHSGSKPYIKIIENIVDKYIAVPPNVLLKEDKLQKIQYTDEEFDKINERLQNLQDRLQRATIFNACLKDEIQVTEQLMPVEDTIHRLCRVINCGFQSLDPNEKLFPIMEGYKHLLQHLPPSSDKEIYNNIGNVKCKKFNIDDSL